MLALFLFLCSTILCGVSSYADTELDFNCQGRDSTLSGPQVVKVGIQLFQDPRLQFSDPIHKLKDNPYLKILDFVKQLVLDAPV